MYTFTAPLSSGPWPLPQNGQQYIPCFDFSRNSTQLILSLIILFASLNEIDIIHYSLPRSFRKIAPDQPTRTARTVTRTSCAYTLFDSATFCACLAAGSLGTAPRDSRQPMTCHFWYFPAFPPALCDLAGKAAHIIKNGSRQIPGPDAIRSPGTRRGAFPGKTRLHINNQTGYTSAHQMPS